MNRHRALLQKNIGVFIAALITSSAVWATEFNDRAPLPLQAERLSEYLARMRLDSSSYSFAGEWITPQSQLAQGVLHRSLLSAVSNVPNQAQEEHLTELERARWRSWLNLESPRGRVRLPSMDARWLAANPSFDPLLSSQDHIRIPPRPDIVAVVKNSGGFCAVHFQANRSPLDYAQSCGESDSAGPWAYLIQPDGEIERFGIAGWNESPQTPPAPGAWIWIPARDKPWSGSFTETLTRFLSAQGAAQLPPTASPVHSEVAPTTGQDIRTLASETKGIHRYRDFEPTASDWGGIGLLQTPTARFAESGFGSISFSRTTPYTRANIMLTPFDWLEAGFRYVDVSNRLYGPDIAGNQSFKDKSIDVKFRLLPESAYLPQIALGFRDLGGTGLFASEYLVANKRFASFDFSLGLGWGYLGGRANISNPLAIFGDKFKTRPQGSTGSARGGDFNASTYFRGPVAVFGGLQYQTPWDRWQIKLEVDGNSYQNEPQDNNQRTNSAINVGAVYQLTKHTQLSLALERGNTVMMGVSFGTNLGALSAPKINEPKPLAVQLERRNVSIAAMPKEDWSALTTSLREQTGWDIREILRRDASLRVVIAMAPTFNWDEVLDRANRVMHAMAPREISTFTYVVHERGLAITEFSVHRDHWAKHSASFVPQPIRINQPAVNEEIAMANIPRPSVKDEVVAKDHRRAFAAGIGLNYSQTLGGPDAFILYQLAADAEAEWRPTENSWVTGVLRLGLLDNYDKFKFSVGANLPRVRSYTKEYLTSSNSTIPVLQATHTMRLTDSIVASVYGGLLERMFAGVGGEMLYKPFGSNIAFGVDINRVRQRGFKQDFSLRDYEVTTGHATLYWHTGWEEILAKISAGQYLAGDRGVTVDLSRVFANGVRIGAYATKTNVSAEDFGEGSFDKGIYVTIPFDAMMTKFSKSEATILWQPVLRDGGAKLQRRFELYDMTRIGSK